MGKEGTFIIIGLVILFGLAFEPLKDQANKKKTGVETDRSSRSSSLGSSKVIDDESQASANIKDIEKEIENLEEEVAEKIAESKRSPYYGKIRMSSISGRNNPDPSKEYIRLSVSLEGNEQVNITGWYLKSEVTNYFVTIGKASLLPFPFTRTESDVILKDNDKVVLVKGFSPIGVSFRTNKCTGYFEENRTFSPSLPKQCPKPIDGDLPRFSATEERNDECLNLIKKVPRCTTRGNEYVRDLPDTVPNSCKTYLTTQINYNSCVASHFKDTDFPGNEYRVYLNKFGTLWKKENEKINLHDSTGLIVDSISY